MKKSYKIRAYPNSKQRELFAKCEGATRYVRNRVLREMKNYHDETGLYKTLNQMSAEVTKWKSEEETKWLKEIPRDVINCEFQDLIQSFDNFFAKRSKYPKRKNRSSSCSIRFQFDTRTGGKRGKLKHWLDRKLCLNKLFGFIELAQPDRITIQAPKLITLSRDCMGRYFISFSVDEEIKPKELTGKSVGIDFGIKTLAYCSDGTKFESPRLLRKKSKLMKYLKRQQRILSRRKGAKKGEVKSNRYLKQKLKVARIHTKIKDIRNHNLHVITNKIVTDYDVIGLEDLNVKGMIKNKKLSRHLVDASFSKFRRQIEYKSNLYGKNVIFSNKWNPTSKMCSGCGQIHDLKLSDRRMTCDCGLDLDRDHNAAINILKFSTAENAGIQARGAVNKPNHSELVSDLKRTAMEPIGSEKRELGMGLGTDRRLVA